MAAEVLGLDALKPDALCWAPMGVLRRPEGMEPLVWELMDWLLMVGLSMDCLLMGLVMAETYVDWKTSAWVWLL